MVFGLEEEVSLHTILMQFLLDLFSDTIIADFADKIWLQA